jgi:hypothetical protein
MKFDKYYFFEKEDTDIKFRNQALLMYDKLFSYINDIENQNMGVTSNGALIIDLDILYKILPFVEDKWSFGYTTFNNKKQPIIILSLLEEPVKNFYIDKNFILKKMKEKKRSIIHELIHYLDFLRADDKEKIMSKEYSLGKIKASKDYYNDPRELNAYYQEVVDDIKQIYNKDLMPIYSNANEFVRDVWYSPNFFDKFFKLNLTLENKKRIKKRLADLYLTLKKDNT